MTGWRVGYATGPLSLIQAMGVIQSQSTSAASSISQAAAVAALEGEQSLVSERAAVYRARRDILLAGLSDLPGIEVATPDGGLFVFAGCGDWLGARTPDGRELITDRDFVDYLLDAARVAAVPGSAFGAPGHFRLSIAAATESIRQAPARIAAAVRALQRRAVHA